MNNDLISKHELTGKISYCLWKYQHEHRDSIKVITDISNEILDIIDNASTVDKGYDFGYADGHGEGYELGKTERLVAKILPEHCIDSDCRGCYNKCTWFKCSKCSCTVNKDDRFCSHCGAKLGGEQ